MRPKEGDEVLRRFRASLPYTDYFLTLCTNDRQAGLTGPMVAAALRAEIRNIERDGYWTIRGAVIMPDHIHLLTTLHDKLPLSRVIARLKSKTRAALATTDLRWQGNYYEHRLREADAHRRCAAVYLSKSISGRLVTSLGHLSMVLARTTRSRLVQTAAG